MSDRVVITERMPDGMPGWVDDAMAVGTLFSEIKARYLMDDRLLEYQREAVATWMIRNGYATGHGDTTEDLLDELKDQIAEKYGRICADAIPESSMYKDHCYLPTARKACLNAIKDKS